jgi:hypothetical protein
LGYVARDVLPGLLVQVAAQALVLAGKRGFFMSAVEQLNDHGL